MINRLPPPLQSNVTDENNFISELWGNFFNQVYRVQSETVWDDMRTPANEARAVAGQEATFVSYKSGVVLSFSTSSDNAIAFNAQLPHTYKEGSDIEFHIHYALPTAGAGAGVENIKWDFTYSWSNIDDAIPDATTVNKTFDVQAKSANTHYLGEIAGTISGTGKKVSSMLICSLMRDISVSDDYADVVYIMEVDFHFQVNTLGSSTETAK